MRQMIRLILIILYIFFLLIGCGGGSNSADSISNLENLKASSQKNMNVISWSPVPTSTKYNIYWSKKSEVTINDILIADVNSPYFHSEIDTGIRYYYLVVALNGKGKPLASTTISPQPFFMPVPKLQEWQTINTNNSLVNNTVQKIYQDSLGNMWFGTANGLCKLDGEKWTTFNINDGLADNNINSILEDSTGSLWFGTASGLSKIDGVDWKTFSTANGLICNYVSTVIEDWTGAIWIGTKFGISKFENFKWVTHTKRILDVDNKVTGYNYVEQSELGNVTALVEDNAGAIWSGQNYNGICITHFDDTYWKIPTQREFYGLLENKKINLIIKDSAGNLLFGTNMGVYKYDGKVWSQFSTFDDIMNEDILSIYEDSTGNIWIGTTNGVSKFDGVAWDKYTTKDGLAGDQVYSILEDDSGNMWFGTNEGVSKITLKVVGNDNLVLKWDDSNLQSDYKLSFYYDTDKSGYDGILIVQGINEVDLANEYTWDTSSMPNGTYYIYFIFENGISSVKLYLDTSVLIDVPAVPNKIIGKRGDSKNIIQWSESFGAKSYNLYWSLDPGVDTEKNVIENVKSPFTHFSLINYYKYYYTVKAINTKGLSESSNEILLEPRGSDLLVVPSFKTNQWETYLNGNCDIYSGITSILQDNLNNLWITSGKGAYKYDGLEWINYTTNDGMITNFLTSIYQGRDGNIWTNSYYGSSRFNGLTWEAHPTSNGQSSGSFQRDIFEDSLGNYWLCTLSGVERFDGVEWVRFNSSDGLAKDQVRIILEDSKGNLWFGTNNGISKFDGNDWVTYTIQDGLAGNNINSILEDSTGSLWFGSTNGISKFDGLNWTTYTKSDEILQTYSPIVHEDIYGNLWFVNILTLNRFDGLEWLKYFFNSGWDGRGDFYDSNYSCSIFEDSLGNVWFINYFFTYSEIESFGTVSKYDGVNWTTYTSSIDGLINNSAKSIFEDSAGNIWIGGDGGLSKFNGEKWETYKNIYGVEDISISHIFEDNVGNMWFGSNIGVTKFIPKIPATNEFKIEWQDTNSQADCKLRFYYDTDKKEFDGTLIVSDIEETDPKNFYIWDTSAVPNGTYYIYLLIYNGKTSERLYFDIPIVID